jgi:hypothetical protein
MAQVQGLTDFIALSQILAGSPMLCCTAATLKVVGIFSYNPKETI